MLREIEYGVRILMWMLSEDGQKGRRQPERIQLPGEGDIQEARKQQAERDALNVAAALGIEV